VNVQNDGVTAADPSLTGRVRASVGWTAASTVLAQSLALFRSVVLARLLSRADFGLYGMAQTVTEALNVLTSMGLDSAVIADKTQDEQTLAAQLNTVWTAELVRRVLLTLLIVAVAWPTARFYGDARLLWILPVLSLKWLLEGFQNIGLVLLRRQVRFARVFWFEQTSLLLYTLSAIGLAWWTRDVRALVLSQALNAVTLVVLSYLFYPYRPRLAFDPALFRRAFHFGKYLFIIGVTTYIMTTADNIVVGKLLGPGILGAYLIAYTIANMCLVFVRDVIGRVMFPAYAELAREGGDRIERAVVRVFAVGSALLVLMAAPMGLLSNEFILLLYGAKWNASGPLLRVLTLVGLLHGLTQMVSALLIGLNRPELDARAKLTEAVVFVLLLTPLTVRYGALGAAWAGVIVYAFAFLARYGFTARLIPGVFGKIAWTILSTLLAGVSGVLAGAGVLRLVASVPLRLLLGGSVTVAVAVLGMLVLTPVLRVEAGTAFLALISRKEVT
jgi:O-antigen/teichoic acid export membrane protein